MKKSLTLKSQKVLSFDIEQWREALPDVVKWSDGGPPSTDINTARMRAKYYDARCIIYLPTLLYVLQIVPKESTYKALRLEIKKACKICIESAIFRAEAFDKINSRLMVPNIFGIAHGQVRNILVLSATYKSGLTELVDRSILQRLVLGNIKFLLRNYTSPSLLADTRILIEVYQGIFE